MKSSIGFVSAQAKANGLRDQICHKGEMFLWHTFGHGEPTVKTMSELNVGSAMVVDWYSVCNMWTDKPQHVK